MDIQKIYEKINELKKQGEEVVELKINLILSLIENVFNLIKEREKNRLEIAILSAQKYNLIVELKKCNVSDKKIQKILNETFKGE